MKVLTRLEDIFGSRPIFDASQCIELVYGIPRRSPLLDSNLLGMASDDKKKKIESLRESISKLETQRTLAKGNKVKLDSIQRMIDRFEKDIKALKTL